MCLNYGHTSKTILIVFLNHAFYIFHKKGFEKEGFGMLEKADKEEKID